MKELNVVFTYKYVNSNRVRHVQEVVFESGGINVAKLSDFEKRLKEAFSGKKSLFNASQLELPDLFYFVPNYEKDTSMHVFMNLDFTTRDVMDFRVIADVVSLSERESEKGWERFDVLEKVTGRIARNIYLKEIESIHKEHTKEIGQLLREHSKKTNQVTKNCNKEIEQFHKGYSKEIALITNVHGKELDIIRKTHSKEIDSLNKSFKQESLALKAKQKKNNSVLERKQIKAKEMLMEASEILDLYLDGEASSDEIEKLVTKINKIKAGL